MYEKENKWSQIATILAGINVQLSNAVHRNINRNTPFFFKTLILGRCFEKV